MKKPIIYEWIMEIRFSDLDPYWHLNSAIFLDIVNTSRLLFLSRKMNMPMDEIVKRGLSFYVKKANQEFISEVRGLEQLRVTSHVNAVVGRSVIASYRIESIDGKTLFSKGELEYFVLNFKSQAKEIPEWFLKLLFEETP